MWNETLAYFLLKNCFSLSFFPTNRLAVIPSSAIKLTQRGSVEDCFLNSYRKDLHKWINICRWLAKKYIVSFFLYRKQFFIHLPTLFVQYDQRKHYGLQQGFSNFIKCRKGTFFNHYLI